MRIGDYIVSISFTLNVCAFLAYAWQGYYQQAVYWMGAMLINGSLLSWR